MKNKYALIGQLKIMKAFSQNETQRNCLNDAISVLKSGTATKHNPEFIAELAAALEMLSYKLCRKDAEVLRDTVEYLESLDCEVQV